MNRRVIALIALSVTVIAVLYVVISALTGWEPSLGWLIQAVIHVGELLAVVALAGSGAAGPGLTARLGLGAAIVGQAILAVAEVLWPGNHDLGDALFGIGPMLTGIGMIVAGIAVVRAGRWTGWSRVVPLVLGIYIFVVMTPALIVSGGPPATVALWAIAGWDVAWALIAYAALTSTAAAGRSLLPVDGRGASVSTP